MKKQILAVVLALIMLFGIIPITAFAEESQNSVWDGSSVATSYQSGNGEKATPYEIATAEQFAYFANQIAEGNGTEASYILNADIDMTAISWTPIGMVYDDYETGKYFHGSFDGNGHTVKYNINSLSNINTFSAIGLFGFAEGEISNLTVDGTISNLPSLVYSYIGGISGLFSGDITDCVSSVDFTLTDGKTNQCYFGGIIGELQAGTIQNSLYSGEMKLTFAQSYGDLYIGGISGTVYDGKIYACKNKGNITVGKTDSNKINNGNVGGIAGMAYTGGDPVTSEVQDCYNEGNISSLRNAGGIVARAIAVISSEGSTAVVKVSNCYSSAKTVTGLSASGAVCASVETNNYAGSATATVENCYYTVGTDSNAAKITDSAELYTKLCEKSTDGLWLKNANGVSCLFWEFKTAETPKATFDAIDDKSGVLGNVDTSMKYSIDGGENWNDVTDTTMTLTDISADKDIQIYRVGDMINTLNSETQTIDITQSAKPDADKIDCKTLSQNDGQITQLNNKIEYKSTNDEKWTSVTGETVTGLTPGKYYVRVKASGTVLASEFTEITVEKHTCVKDDVWHSDEIEHWNTCSCGEKQNKAEHTFIWVTDKSATTTENGSRHEECTVCGYAKTAETIPATATTTDNNTDKSNTVSPNTGDNGNIWMWFALLFVSGGGLLGTTAYRRKRKETEN